MMLCHYDFYTNLSCNMKDIKGACAFHNLQADISWADRSLEAISSYFRPMGYIHVLYRVDKIHIA